MDGNWPRKPGYGSDVVGVRALHLPFSSTRGRKARHRADNAAIGGAVPLWWINYLYIARCINPNLLAQILIG